MKGLFRFECGDTVKDTLTGFTGSVRVRSEYLSGNIRFYVQPTKLKDGKPADGVWFDDGALKLVKAGNLKRPARDFKFNIGDEVKDQWTDHTGVIVVRSDHVHSCIRYDVQPRKLNADGKLFEALSHDEGALELVKSNEVPAKAPEKRTGAIGVRAPLSRRDPVVR